MHINKRELSFIDLSSTPQWVDCRGLDPINLNLHSSNVFSNNAASVSACLFGLLESLSTQLVSTAPVSMLHSCKDSADHERCVQYAIMSNCRCS